MLRGRNIRSLVNAILLTLPNPLCPRTGKNGESRAYYAWYLSAIIALMQFRTDFAIHTHFVIYTPSPDGARIFKVRRRIWIYVAYMVCGDLRGLRANTLVPIDTIVRPLRNSHIHS